MNQLAFLDNKQMRDENIERLEVLNQAGELLSLHGGEIYTVDLLSSYFDVGNEAITSIYKRNTEELNMDGAGVKNKEDFLKFNMDFKTKRGGFDVISGGKVVATGSNKGILLFTKRAVLRVGMLLRDSEVAKELRTRLLDIVHDAGKTTTDNGNTIVENVVNEISEENKLMANIGIAICSGDMTKVIEAQTLYNNFKNNQLKQREEKIEVLERSAATIEDFKRQSNALIRSLAKTQEKTESEVWNNFYGYLERKEGYKLKTRQQNKMLKLNNDRIASGKEPYKKSTLKAKVSILSTIKDTEYDSIIKILKGICSKEGIDVISVLSFS